MATLKNNVSGESCLLKVNHVFGRDAERCDTLIQDAYVSRVHAMIHFNGGQWNLLDQSSNGTLLSGTLLRHGEHAPLREGDLIRFGKAVDGTWEVADLSDPVDTLWPIRPPARPILLEFSQVLPGDITPSISVTRSANGEWLCDDAGSPRVLHHGDVVTAGKLSWRLEMARNDQTLALIAPPALAGPPARIEFAISLNEEHVHAVLHTRGGAVDLGERAHHYCLATLARLRFADAQAGYESGSQGWVEMPELSRMLGLDVAHVNVQIHRARAQFAALPGDGKVELIERRRGSVRFGNIAFRVMRGEQPECLWVPSDPLIGDTSRGMPPELMRHALSS